MSTDEKWDKSVASLWLGPDLGPLELLTLKSWIKLGYAFTLYSDKKREVPLGVECKEYTEITGSEFPKGEVFNYSANFFRYLLLKRHATTWVDMDAVGWRVLESEDFLVGRESNEKANNGLLRIPASEYSLLDALIARYKNPWLAFKQLDVGRKVMTGLRFLKSGHINRSMRSQVIAGPDALTFEIKKKPELWQRTRAISDFYPVHYSCSDIFFERANPALFQNSYSIHLWAATRKKFNEAGFTPGSNLAYIREQIG